MFSKFLIAIGGFLLVVLTLGAVKVAQIKDMMGMSHQQPPISVTTTVANQDQWNTYLNAIGTLAPVEGVMISADADGTIVRIAADSGSVVVRPRLTNDTYRMSTSARSTKITCHRVPEGFSDRIRIDRVRLPTCGRNRTTPSPSRAPR